jgi:hypothetical protein
LISPNYLELIDDTRCQTLFADISVATATAAAAGDGERGLHVHWSAKESARPAFDLAAGMGVLMANLARPWVSQTFDTSISDATRQLLAAEMAHIRWIKAHPAEPEVVGGGGGGGGGGAS